MNGLYRFRGLMVIALWQTAPPIAKTEDGKFQIGLGYGSSKIEEVFFTGGPDCEGNGNEPVIEHRRTHRPRSFGASLSGMLTSKLRMGAAVSTTSADTSALSGFRFRSVVAMEWKNFGVGSGLMSDESFGLIPGLYLRGGRLDGFHVRFDIPDVSLPTTTTGMGRYGVAYNQTASGFGAFIGIPFCYTGCTYDEEGIRVDARVPVFRSLDAHISGFRQERDNLDYWGLATGVSMKF